MSDPTLLNGVRHNLNSTAPIWFDFPFPNFTPSTLTFKMLVRISAILSYNALALMLLAFKSSLILDAVNLSYRPINQDV